MKKITKATAETVLYKVDTEGIGYSLLEGYLDDLEDTELNKEFQSARNSLAILNVKLDELREKFGIEVS